jgi:cytoskeletal protein RodZ
MSRPCVSSTALLGGLAVLLAIIGVLLLRAPAPSTPATASPSSPGPVAGSSSPSTSRVATMATRTASMSTSAITSPSSTSPTSPTSTTEQDEFEPIGDLAPSGGIPATPASTLEQRQAVVAAEAFMRAFARPPAGVDRDPWWAAVAKLMTPQGRLDYAGVDPTRVPFTRLTGPGLIQPQPQEADSHVQTLVRIPTDAGDYLIALEHRQQEWLVARATPQGSTR